jgi:hypothetical protein
MVIDRYEKEFDGVQDVFELQVRLDPRNVSASGTLTHTLLRREI